MRVCEENGFVKPTVYQGDYNLVTRGMESELLPTLKELKLNFYAFRYLTLPVIPNGNHLSMIPYNISDFY
jgi:aflatoxin B1 aldehyde reductase